MVHEDDLILVRCPWDEIPDVVIPYLEMYPFSTQTDLGRGNGMSHIVKFAIDRVQYKDTLKKTLRMPLFTINIFQLTLIGGGSTQSISFTSLATFDLTLVDNHQSVSSSW